MALNPPGALLPAAAVKETSMPAPSAQGAQAEQIHFNREGR